jgi:hypothetical protein
VLLLMSSLSLTFTSASLSRDEEVDRVVMDQLSEDRIEAVLHGAVPCPHVPLFAAYKSALRDIGMQSHSFTQRDFHPKELCSLLRTSNDAIRTLGYRIIQNLSKEAEDTGAVSAAGALKEMVKCGMLPLLFMRLDELRNNADAKLELGLQIFSATTQGIEALNVCEAINSLATAKVFDQETKSAFPDVSQLAQLAGAAAGLFGNLFYHDGSETKSVFSVAILGTLTMLIRSLHFFEGLWYAERGSILFLELYDNQLNNKRLMSSAVFMVQSMPRTEFALTGSMLIRYGTNSANFCRSFVEEEVDGLQRTLECIASTSHDDNTLRNLLIAIGNFSSQGPGPSRMIVECQGFDLLQPVVMNDNSVISLSACYAICSLAAEKSLDQAAGCQDALHVVTDVLRMLPPGSLKLESGWSPCDLQKIASMISPDAHPTVQLCALHWIGKSFHIPRNQATFSSSSWLHLLRMVAASHDPFVYMAAIHLMRTTHAPLSTFRQFSAEVVHGKSQIPVSEWTVEMVCNWVSTHPFRKYRQLFRDGFVNGRMLLAITNDILIEKNVTDVWHRQSILFAIDDLRERNAVSPNGPVGHVEQVTTCFNCSLERFEHQLIHDSDYSGKRFINSCSRHFYFLSTKRRLRLRAAA